MANSATGSRTATRAGVHRRLDRPRRCSTRTAHAWPGLCQRGGASDFPLHLEQEETKLIRRVDPQLFVSLSSFFNLHTATRTLSNSTETALTAWAWAYWPWEWIERRQGESGGKADEWRVDAAHEFSQCVPAFSRPLAEQS